MKFETTFQTEPKQDSLKEVRCEKGISDLEKLIQKDVSQKDKYKLKLR